MKRVVCHIFLLFLLLATGSTVLWAEEQLPQKLQKLTDEAYRCYSARETENFFESIKRVKDATEFSDYQETYYRACSYEAIYMFEYVDRQKGVELSHAIYHHAKDNSSDVGMYFATFTLGTIREQSGNKGLAEKSFLQALKLKEAYDQLEETTAAKERIESELRIAREIQKRMLPHVFPRRRDVDIYAMMTPAKEVGGDLYAYALLDDLLYFCVGDVSGKGVPAALFMAEVTRMFRTLVDGHLTPNTIATRLNHALVEDNEQGMFVTMFIGLINLKTGHMEFCNAGHNPPLLDGEYMKVESNAPIGLWQEVEYEGEEVDDMHGKTLFVYTDGINEAENIHKEQFGDDRLKALLQQDWGDARQTSEQIHKAVEDFVGGAEPSDDLTKMCIKMK